MEACKIQIIALNQQSMIVNHFDAQRASTQLLKRKLMHQSFSHNNMYRSLYCVWVWMRWVSIALLRSLNQVYLHFLFCYFQLLIVVRCKLVVSVYLTIKVTFVKFSRIFIYPTNDLCFDELVKFDEHIYRQR